MISCDDKGVALQENPCNKARLDGDRNCDAGPQALKNKDYAAVAQG